MCGGFIALKLHAGMHLLHCVQFVLFMCGGSIVVVGPSFWSTGIIIAGICAFADCAIMFVMRLSAIAVTIFAVVFAVVGESIIRSYLVCVIFPAKG